LEEENFDEAVKSVNTALVPNSVCCIVFVLSRTIMAPGLFHLQIRSNCQFIKYTIVIQSYFGPSK
jgi:hypothetical protein